MITEFGYNLLAWDDGSEKTEHGHIMIQEYLNYHNTTFVANNRDVGFIFIAVAFLFISF